jgi:hypothetical protein
MSAASPKTARVALWRARSSTSGRDRTVGDSTAAIGRVKRTHASVVGSFALHSPVERPQQKIENHMAAVAINYFAYNFIKIHRTLRVTPGWRQASRTGCSDVMKSGGAVGGI